MEPSDFDELFDSDFDPDLLAKKRWAKVPEPIRKIVEQHVAAHLPGDILAKLRDLDARGLPISHDDAFFHFGGGMGVRNLCRERLDDDELAAWRGLGRQLGRLLYRGARRDRRDAAVGECHRACGDPDLDAALEQRQQPRTESRGML